MIKELLEKEFNIDSNVLKCINWAQEEVQEEFRRIDTVKEYNQLKVIRAMQRNNLSDTHFPGTTGYGYDDKGRDVLDNVYKDVFKAEDALVRHQIVSGTHALALCLYGNLRPGDELLCVTGKPYDTLEEVIGIRGEGGGSLKEFGVTYSQVELLENGKPDLDSIGKSINERTRMVLIQRSRGYEWRQSQFVTLSSLISGKACLKIGSLRKSSVSIRDK
jgi:cystathionine beta-lyase family protein involved in aluminum resistance